MKLFTLPALIEDLSVPVAVNADHIVSFNPVTEFSLEEGWHILPDRCTLVTTELLSDGLGSKEHTIAMTFEDLTKLLLQG